MIKSYYDKKPQILEKIENGKYFYRWDIQEHISIIEEQERHDWECYEIIVYSTLTANKILEKAIESLWGHNIEQKMLNDYNAANLGILEESYIDKYKEFLNSRKRLKAQIDSDCAKLNIK